MKKYFKIAAITLISSLILASCAGGKEKVVIYTSIEDYCIEYMQPRLKEEFPDYDIVLEYMSTGNHAAKLLSEGVNTECDITYDLEYGYLEKLETAGVLANLSEFGFDNYVDDAVVSEVYHPQIKVGGCIVVNTELLTQKGLAIPQSYADLIKPEYKGLVSMPSPKSSGTGYIFYKALVNAWGESEALEYFDKLSENILQFTASGSGPMNALIQGEAAIALTMTSSGATAISEGHSFELLFFEEGSPFTYYGQGIIKGKETRQAVKDVYAFIEGTLNHEISENFFPEKLFKDKDFITDNYPTNIEYANMENSTPEEKERLLALWKY